jgi:NADPH:quinone reductase-like Zn-dependent oxidoreductase
MNNASLFHKENLHAWCFVPYDKLERPPSARAEMLRHLGISRYAYDWREKHIPTFDEEVEASLAGGLTINAWWFTKSLDERGHKILEVIARHGIRPDLWVMQGTPLDPPEGLDQAMKDALENLFPIIEAAAERGLRVALYNHGGWFGEPENQLQLLDTIRGQGFANVGLVYNLHHGHAHLGRMQELIALMKPHLLAFNLNGMSPNGDQFGKKLLPLGQGECDLEILRMLDQSGWTGPVGILNHTEEDAQLRLQDNLDGLAWLAAKLEGDEPAAKPVPRTWNPETVSAIRFIAPGKAELAHVAVQRSPIDPGEVRGRTLVSLVSPGTELNHNYHGKNFPNWPGYSNVFEVEEVGSAVENIRAGDVVFSFKGGHTSRQAVAAEFLSLVPQGLAPEAAVFARLAGVSMTTLNTAAARTPAKVLITGLGPVGNLAAQIFQHCGYRVTGVDPVESRRALAHQTGIHDVRASIADAPADLLDQVALHVECSGHEQAVLDGCKLVHRKGEVVLVGVPWQKKTDMAAFDLLHAVFHRYVVLRSGWEHEIPATPESFAFHSKKTNYEEAMRWIAEGALQVRPLAAHYSPARAGEAYDALARQTCPAPTVLFDWREV